MGAPASIDSCRRASRLVEGQSPVEEASGSKSRRVSSNHGNAPASLLTAAVGCGARNTEQAKAGSQSEGESSAPGDGGRDRREPCHLRPGVQTRRIDPPDHPVRQALHPVRAAVDERARGSVRRLALRAQVADKDLCLARSIRQGEFPRTTCSPGELRALRWRDVRESPYPHMVVSKSHDGPTKSRKVREVPLLPEAQDVLDSLTGRTGTVFSLPETASWIRRHVIGHSRVKDFHVHRLRHTFACRYLERGGSLEALQRMLGHSTVRLTERYGRLRPEVVAAEV